MPRRLFTWMSRVALCACMLLRVPGPGYGQNAVLRDSLLAAVAKTSSDTDKAKIMLSMAAIYNADTVTKKYFYASEALRLSEKAGWDKGIMYAERIIGDCYNNVLAYNDALVHLSRSADMAAKINRPDARAVSFQFMVHSYHMLNDMPRVLDYQSRIMKIVERSGDAANECAQRSAYAIFLSEAGEYRRAIDVFKENMVFANARFVGDKRANTVGDILNSLSLTYIIIHRTDSALVCLRSAADLARQAGNTELSAYINSSFCDVYAATKQYDSAIMYGIRTMREAEALKLIALQLNYCQSLSKLYDASGKPAEALAYYKRSDSLLSVINDTRKTVSDANTVAKINMTRQADRDMLEKRSLETIRREQRAALIAAALAIVAFVVLTIFIYRNLRQKQKANKIISSQAASLREQNGLIDKALREKEVLLKETHHRVKNNLQLISSLLELQAANLEDENAKDALRAAQRRVLSIAVVHGKLFGSDDEESIDLSAFVDDLFSRLNGAFGNEKKTVSFQNQVPAISLPLNMVVLLGLILNELVTNSFKHAFGSGTPAVITIGLSRLADKYILTYRDNGPGLRDGQFDSDSGSLGLYLVKRLSKQLKGSAAYHYDAGSVFTIEFSYAGG